MKKLLFIAVAIVAMAGCKETEYVMVPEYHTDTLRVVQNVHDSIHVHDSIQVMVKGDSVLVDRWHKEYVLKEVHDTLYQSRTDSVPYPVPVPEYIEKELTRWQKAKMNLGLVFMGVLGVAVCVGGYRFRKKYLL